jgi:GTP-binding protein
MHKFNILKQRFRAFCTFTSRKDDIYTIALIGRTNVGKSTLFNRLLGEKTSLVDNTPGLTRDRKEAYTNLFGVKIRLVDTAGVDDLENRQSYNEIVNKTISQTRQALLYSDLAFFIIDARVGVTPTDIGLAKWLGSLRGEKKQISSNFYENLKQIKDRQDIKIPRIVLVANKVEDDYVPSDVYNEYQKLKFDEPLYISAEHGDNLVLIYNIE